MKTDQSPLRVIDVITSCKNMDQLRSAEKFSKLFLKNYSGPDTDYLSGMGLRYVFEKALVKMRKVILKESLK